jgi:hypothetical protein
MLAFQLLKELKGNNEIKFKGHQISFPLVCRHLNSHTARQLDMEFLSWCERRLTIDLKNSLG